ncbi:MAG: glycosyltransferase family 2 protein, partial [Prevotellaceae bacterium]|nr:glycosyltransferase family 2 protein [Prevotellaceae bacterium]
MSTYNGERYIEEQIESILSQENVDCKLLVRDDGSTDKTTEILDSYQNKNMLTWYTGNNLGPARSFMQLLFDSDEAEYYAFSDQDDYWKPEKLKVAVDSLCNYEDIPALYFCQTQLTDAQLNPIESVKINPLLTFGESLVYEFIGGCTIVMNRKLRDILIEYNPSYLPMHDVWVYSVALAVGAKIVFDKTPHILYRQHGTNTIGQGHSAIHEWKRRWKRFYSNEHSRYRRALEIRNGYSIHITTENKNILDSFISGHDNLFRRMKLLFDNRLECANINTGR